MTPSSVTFSLMTIFPMSVLRSLGGRPPPVVRIGVPSAGSGPIRRRPVPGSPGPVMMQAPRRRESGRPPAAQFGPWPTSIHGGSGQVREEGDAPVVAADLMSRARAGDGDAFRELTEPHLRELQVHCYRMLGSFQDAEDALQDTLLTAWQGLAGFEGRASLRTWLYRIATNRCLDARRAASRRPAREWDVPGVEPPEPTRLGEVVWLQPYPDARLEGAAGVPPGPEARYEQAEAISLAFVTALQLLPPRQLAVLVLRDVLGFHASEVAGILDSTVESVNSALKRARASLQRRWPAAGGGEPPRGGGPPGGGGGPPGGGGGPPPAPGSQ